MRGFAFLLFALTAAIFPIAARTEEAPVGKLIDTKTAPSCLTAHPSWIASHVATWSTGNEEPAVQVNNNCADAAVITGFETGSIEAPKPVPFAEGSRTQLVNGSVQYLYFIFSSREESCTAGKTEAVVFDVRKQWAEKDYALFRETRIVLKKQPMTLEQYIEMRTRDERQNKIDPQQIVCKKIPLPRGGTVTLPVEWDNAYILRGYLMNEEKIPVQVEGKMIDPRKK